MLSWDDYHKEDTAAARTATGGAAPRSTPAPNLAKPKKPKKEPAVAAVTAAPAAPAPVPKACSLDDPDCEACQ